MTILPSEIITTVTGSPQSVFPVPAVDTSPELFTATDVTLQVELNGTVQTISTHYSETPTGYVTFVTPVPVGSTVRISRTTVSSAPLVTASVSSMFSTTMFNKGFWQLLFLIQELQSKVLKALSYVITSLGEVVWDFQSHRGINCVDPTEDQDVATKHYVDDGDASVLATATALVNAEASARSAGDSNTLAAAQAYTRAWFPSITYVSGTSIPLVPSSQVCAAGTTIVYFPVAVYDVILCINGMFQRPTVDYSYVPGNNFVTLTDPLIVSSTITAYIIVDSGSVVTFSSETITFDAGITVFSTSGPFDNAFVIIDGSLQAFGIDYTHVFGTNTITLSEATKVAGVMQVIIV